MACPGHGQAATAAAHERAPAFEPGTAPALTVAGVFERFFEACAEVYPLTPEQRRVARDIVRCRTAELGGHLQYCHCCGHEWPVYNPCYNRHCPTCQGSRQLAWIRTRLERLLETHYFHVVFTVPRSLRGLALANREAFYDLLLRSAADTLLALGRDPERLGAELGVTTVLHTWSRDLQLHPHVHCIVTGGGLNAEGTRWVSARRRYLFPGRVMAALFRGKLLAGLEALREQGRLRFPGILAQLTHPVAWADFKDRLYRTHWVVHAKRPFGGPAQIVRYLGLYTHRVAICNSRLVAIDGGRVRFRTRGAAEVSLSGVEFVRRFLLHVLPKGFRKIRHYGLVAPTQVRTRLRQAQALLVPKPAPFPLDDEPDPGVELLERIWQPRCPRCGSTRLSVTYVPLPAGGPTSPASNARPPPPGGQPGAVHA